MSGKSLFGLVFSATLLAVCALLIKEMIELESPSLVLAPVLYAALIMPIFCHILPQAWSKWAWVATLGVLVSGLWVTTGSHIPLSPHVWFELLVMAIVLIAYAIALDSVAFWEAELVRSLVLGVRSNLLTSEAIERERLRQSEGMLALCQRLNLPLSILHFNWISVEARERQSFRIAKEIAKEDENFRSCLERLKTRDCLIQHVRATTRISDIVLSDGTPDGFFVICPATPEEGAEVLSTRIESALRNEFKTNVKHSVATSVSNGFVLANLMVAAKEGKPMAEYGTVVSLR